MSSLPGRRAGLAILRIELEDAVADRVLIRVQTIDDVVGDTRSQERSFASCELALAHLRDWLEDWCGPHPADRRHGDAPL
jgi:hypothetical protein